MKTFLAAAFVALALASGIHADTRKLLQTTPGVQQQTSIGTPATITVSAANPLVNAITITLARPYPQNAFFCNVTGDNGIPQEGVFPLTVRVPVGVTSTVVFANITGPIPGTVCQSSSVVQQPGGTSVVQQQSSPNSVVQQTGSSSVVQQTSVNSIVQQQAGGAVVQQQYATSINQQNPNMTPMNCVANTSSVVQQQGSSVVQQQQSTPSSVVQQQQSTPSSVVQQQSSPSSVVQQQQSPPSSVVQQSTPSSVVQQQQSTPSSVVQQQSTPSSVVQQQQSTPSSVVQQQQSPPSSVVQQSTPSSVVQQSGRHLLQAGTIEYISNNGSTGQPQLTVLDTVEGVPNIKFAPTAVGQTASFTGALQVAVTTTNDGFGTPYIPYRVDSRLSPQCGVRVNFISF